MNKNEMAGMSLSHATLRNEDLIPSFTEFLEHNFPVEYADILADKDYYYILEFGYYDSETAYYLLESLFDILDEIAPSDHYFGAHFGDGSLFGFWQNEDEF